MFQRFDAISTFVRSAFAVCEDVIAEPNFDSYAILARRLAICAATPALHAQCTCAG
jgi:hypothetical protein